MALNWPDPAGRELQILGPRPASREALGDHCPPRRPGTGIAPADAVGRLSTVTARRRQGRDGYVGPEAHRPHPPSRCSWLDESFSHGAGSPRPGSSKAREARLGAAPRAARMLSRVGLVQEPPPAARLAAASAARLSAAALSHMAILASAACGIRPGRASRIDPGRPDQGGGVEAACARAANFGISHTIAPWRRRACFSNLWVGRITCLSAASFASFSAFHFAWSSPTESVGFFSREAPKASTSPSSCKKHSASDQALFVQKVV